MAIRPVLLPFILSSHFIAAASVPELKVGDADSRLNPQVKPAAQPRSFSIVAVGKNNFNGRLGKDSNPNFL